MRLHQDILAILRALDGDSPAGALPSVPTEAPKQLFEYNFVSRLGSGELQLTKTGARALFQAECIEALEQTLAGARPDMASGVLRWLTSSGFLHAGDKTITTRGKLWLASLTPEAPPGSAPVAGEQQAPSQGDFGGRPSA